MLLRLIVLVVVAALCLSGFRAQEAEEEPQQVTLNREKLEQLLSLMSPACRVEMESALTAQTQMSNECREEVQVAFGKLGVDLQAAANAGRAGLQDSDDSQSQDNTRRSERRTQQEDTATKGDSTATILAIVGFVVALLGGAAGYVFYVSSQLEGGKKPPKKLSKKKASRF